MPASKEMSMKGYEKDLLSLCKPPYRNEAQVLVHWSKQIIMNDICNGLKNSSIQSVYITCFGRRALGNGVLKTYPLVDKGAETVKPSVPKIIFYFS